MNKYKIILSCLPFLCLGMLGACGNGKKDNQHDEADELFRQTLALGKSYTDSIRNAKDSLQVISLMGDYEKRIEKIYFSFPPDLDEKLSEWQNEELIKVSANLIAVRNKKLKRLGKTEEL